MTYLIISVCMIMTLPFLSYLNKQANKNSPDNGQFFKMPKAYFFIGYVVIFISLAILIVPRQMENSPEYYHPLVWVVILFTFLFGLYIIRLYAVHKITINGAKFTVYSSFGQKTTFHSDNIKSLKISYATYFITITDKEGQKGKVYFHLQGLIKLLREIKSKSGSDISILERILKI